MSKRSETIAHNVSHINRMLEQQSKAATTGDTCPKCGGGANPTILANFGHCLACQSAKFFGR